MQIKSLIVFCIEFMFFTRISDSRRTYSIDKRLQETRYDGRVLSYSQAINGLKFLSNTARHLSHHSNGADNSTLEDAFSEIMYETITNKLKEQIKSGTQTELERTPSLDPLRLDRLHLEPTIGGDPFDITLKNLKVRGLSSFTLRDLTPKLSELRFRISVVFPAVVAECHYAVNGTVYDVFDLHGTGFGTMQYDEVLMRTSVNMELNNGSLRIVSADAPYVDFAKASITLKGSDGRVTSGLNAVANELGPVLFWMLADQVVDETDYFVANYLNDAIKGFKLPANFKPVVTWLMKRQNIPSPILKRLFPVSTFGSFGNLFHTISGLKHQFNIPMVLESLRSNFRSNFRRFL